MLEIRDYVKSKEVTIEELKKYFILTGEYGTSNHSLDLCGDCLSGCNCHELRSESWTSVIYCWACKSITVMIHTDRMSGNHTSACEIYKSKQP